MKFVTLSYPTAKLIVDVYELINLYAFVKKCQFMNQILCDVKNRSKYNRTNDNEIITSNEKIVPANIKTITSTIETSSFCQITSVSTSRQIMTFISFKIINQQSFEVSQINVMKCYNCNKMNHLIRNCSNFFAIVLRNAIIKKIIIENEKLKKE